MQLCTLCGLGLNRNTILDAGQSFCCHGCHAVYKILLSKNALSDPKNHPIFIQAVNLGLISNPALLKTIEENKKASADQTCEKIHLEIHDMWCPSCAELISLVVGKEKGIRSCVVDYATDLSILTFDPKQISKERIYNLMQSLGYTPKPLQDVLNPPIPKPLKLRFIVAAFCALNLMMFATPLYATYLDLEDDGFGTFFAWASFFTALPVIFYSAWPILKKGFLALSIGLLTMETLIIIGAISAFTLSIADLINGGNEVYFDSMSVIITFMLLGKIIELKAKFSSKNALFRIVRSLPKRGRKLFQDGSEQIVDIKDVQPGDFLVAVSGEKIILDGIVAEGTGTCDESLITGESIPTPKSLNDLVLAGTLVQQGRIVYRAQRKAEESTLQRIVSLVEQDLSNKGVYERIPDKIVQWFVPAVLGLALLCALYCIAFGISDNGLSSSQTALYRAIAILLISCPCAIGIAAPLVESRLIHALAELGAIVRNRGVLRFLGKEDDFLFDKTGTLTKGKFVLVDGLAQIPLAFIPVLKGLSGASIHPLAKAIHDSIPGHQNTPPQVEEIPGQGLIGSYPDGKYFVGSKAFVEKQGNLQLTHSESENQILKTYVFFGKIGETAYPLALGDQLRESAPEAVAALRPAACMVLSGDSPHITARVAQLCGIENWKAPCSPQDKREIALHLRNQGRIVAMAGDGINDAPALAAAHIGLSMVTASDLSIQSSDILLTTDNLKAIPEMRKLAVRARSVIAQNLFWAFSYNVVGLFLAFFGQLSPLFAAFAMVASSIFVIFNAKRI